MRSDCILDLLPHKMYRFYEGTESGESVLHTWPLRSHEFSKPHHQKSCLHHGVDSLSTNNRPKNLQLSATSNIQVNLESEFKVSIEMG